MLIDKRGYNVKLYYSAVKNIFCLFSSKIRFTHNNNNNNSTNTHMHIHTHKYRIIIFKPNILFLVRSMIRSCLGLFASVDRI